VELGSGREGDLALAPGSGVEQQGQAPAPGAGGQALQAAVVVDVAVGDDDGPQPGRVDLHDVEVVGQAPGVMPPSYRIELRLPPALTVTMAEKPCSATSCSPSAKS
jgi:hypothetical protein